MSVTLLEPSCDDEDCIILGWLLALVPFIEEGGYIEVTNNKNGSPYTLDNSIRNNRRFHFAIHRYVDGP